MESNSPGPREVDAQDGGATVTMPVVQEWLKDRYVLKRELGRGGFGITYLAADTGLSSRKVVVKVPLQNRSNDAWSLKKFRTETDALARIDHPGVVAVLDCGECPDGRPFIVMQYVAGSPLRQLIPREGMPLARVADILLQAGRAVSAAHDAGVLHRDLKPENIMLQTREGGEESVKVIDFGLAGVFESVVPIASTRVVGTWQYMAPEQFEGKSFAATDVYQLGILAYELVTGVAPFRSTTAPALLSEKQSRVKILPRDLRPDLPEAAERVMLRALSPDPAQRSSSPREFGEELARCLLQSIHEHSTPAAELLRAEPPKDSLWRIALKRWRIAASVVGTSLIVWLVLSTTGPPRTRNRIAVLPFKNRTGDRETAYIADGITEALINDLSLIPALNVAARGTVIAFENSTADPLAAGRRLSADRVVLGSVWKTGGKFQISVELMEVESGSHVWGGSYNTADSSLSNAISNVSTDITDQLRVSLSGAYKLRRTRQYTVGSAAYSYYLKGRFDLNKRTAEDLNSAIQNFELALSVDPSYAPAHAAMAYAYTLLAFNGSSFPGSANTTQAYALKEARLAASRALELDGMLAEAYASLALVQMQADYEWDKAELTFRRAIDLDPKWAETRESYGLELAALGRTDDGLREIWMAETLEPENRSFKIAQALVLYYARRYDESLGVLNAVMPDARDLREYGDMFAQNYWAKSMNDRALTSVLSIPDASAARLGLVAAAYARVGQRSKAKFLLNQHFSSRRIGSWYDVALAQLYLGDKMAAIQDLNRDRARRTAEVLFVGVDPLLDPLRSEAGFRALLAELNLATNP